MLEKSIQEAIPQFTDEDLESMVNIWIAVDNKTDREKIFLNYLILEKQRRLELC